MIPHYPDSIELSINLRSFLHPGFQVLEEGISEFTFANLYLFRKRYSYRLSRLDDSHIVITGEKAGKAFFLLPFGLPTMNVLEGLFLKHGYLKLVPESIAEILGKSGFTVTEDRDNFDYLYLREKLANLDGKMLHKKRNLVNAFVNNYSFIGKPVWSDNVPDALSILQQWREAREDEGDYSPAKEALENIEQLGLCGSIVYTDGEPAAYTLGEELKGGTCFAIHFEKAIEKYKGIYQFVNKCFVSLLPEKYEIINREQDIGDDGLRQAKMSYKPYGFVKKYIVHGK